MYPPGFQTHVDPGPLAEPMEGTFRPGHFRGVATVVTKLFLAVRPDVAVFGEKDHQQLAIIRRMTTDLDFGIEVVGVPTVREHDGVAMSSRNRRLDAATSGSPPGACPAALDAARDAVASGARRAALVVAAARQVVAAEPLARLEYAEICHPVSLERVDLVTEPAVLAVAVWVGQVRLIDNVTLLPPAKPAASPPADGCSSGVEQEHDGHHRARCTARARRSVGPMPAQQVGGAAEHHAHRAEHDHAARCSPSRGPGRRGRRRRTAPCPTTASHTGATEARPRMHDAPEHELLDHRRHQRRRR